MREIGDGHIDMAEMLIDMGININALDDDLETALLKTIQCDEVASVRLLLLRNDADVNIRYTDDRTALMCALEFEYFDIAHELLKREDIDVHIKDKGGWTALMHAVHSDSPNRHDIIRNSDS